MKKQKKEYQSNLAREVMVKIPKIFERGNFVSSRPHNFIPLVAW